MSTGQREPFISPRGDSESGRFPRALDRALFACADVPDGCVGPVRVRAVGAARTHRHGRHRGRQRRKPSPTPWVRNTPRESPHASPTVSSNSPVTCGSSRPESIPSSAAQAGAEHDRRSPPRIVSLVVPAKDGVGEWEYPSQALGSRDIRRLRLPLVLGRQERRRAGKRRRRHRERPRAGDPASPPDQHGTRDHRPAHPPRDRSPRTPRRGWRCRPSGSPVATTSRPATARHSPTCRSPFPCRRTDTATRTTSTSCGAKTPTNSRPTWTITASRPPHVRSSNTAAWAAVARLAPTMGREGHDSVRGRRSASAGIPSAGTG